MTKEEIIKLVEENCPELAEACKVKVDKVVFHQLAFDEGELLLLGAVIKYIGYFDKDVIVVKGEKS
jgi:hypothetical protein